MHLTLFQILEILSQDYYLLVWGPLVLIVCGFYLLRVFMYSLLSIDTVVSHLNEINQTLEQLSDKLESLENKGTQKQPVFIKLPNEYIGPFTDTREIRDTIQNLNDTVEIMYHKLGKS